MKLNPRLILPQHLPTGLARRWSQVSLAAAVVMGALCGVPAGAAPADTAKPNIVFILADDLGVGDTPCYEPNAGIPMPNLDRLSHEGTVFDDAHAAGAICSPSRYAILTGRYAWRTRLQRGHVGQTQGPLIKPDEWTIGKFLQGQGYVTACFGKWHLGMDWPGARVKDWDFTKPIEGGPITRGFDVYFGVNAPNFPPFTFIDQDRVTVLPSEWLDPATSELCKQIKLDPHYAGPIAPDWDFFQIVPTLTSKTVDFLDSRGKDGKPFFLYASLTSPHEPIAPSPPFQGKSELGPLGDFLIEMDWAVGEILAALDRNGLSENTLVIFTGDNGHFLSRFDNRAGPYRGLKRDVWEGGHREPFIARWPGKVPSGARCDHLIGLWDFFATCADMLDTEIPDGAAVDSVSFLPSLLDPDGKSPRQQAVNHSGDGQFAVRDGSWKLVFGAKPGEAELYNLETDVAETTDLSAQHPERVATMVRHMEAIIAAHPNDVDVKLWKPINHWRKTAGKGADD